MSWKDWLLVAAACMFFYALNSRATEVDFKYGLGLIDKKPTAEIKAFSLRAQERISRFFLLAAESGIWADAGHLPRKSAMFGQWQLGVRPESEHFYVQGFWGVAAIGPTDSQLGGPFQFAQDLGFGFKDKWSSIGLNYKHISSAGIYKPNRGRDFIQAVIGISFE